MNLGLAYEARARVALAQLDADAWEKYSSACEESFATAGNPSLFAKTRRLKRDAQKKQLVSVRPAMDAGPARGIAVTVLKSRLRACADADGRAHLALKLLADQSGASDGLMFRVTEDGPVWVASIGKLEPSAALHAMAREYIAGETHGHEATTGSEVDTELRTEWTSFGESSFRPVLLSHYVDGGYAITGLAVFAVTVDQPFTYPGETAANLSRLAVEHVDVSAVPRFDD